jgi:hypothetical protein
MFNTQQFILLFIITCSDIQAAIYDETYLNKNGPLGMIKFKKNDSFIDWIRVPEASYNQWISTMQIWRTVSLIYENYLIHMPNY